MLYNTPLDKEDGEKEWVYAEKMPGFLNGISNFKSQMQVLLVYWLLNI